MKTALNKILLIVLLLCLTVLPLTAQTGKFYSTNNELSSSLINQIFQDKRGFIWIATEYGLNRFDGLRFSNYKHISGDSTSIKNNYVRTLFEDSRQNLLVGCIDGLMKYDSETDTFREIPMIRAGKRVFPHITQMQKLHNGEIWVVTTGQGIFRLDEEKQQAESIDAIMRQVNYNFQSNLYEDSDYNIWIGTEGHGLICYLPATQEVRVFRYPVINDNYVSAIGEDKYGNLFIGTQKHGLSRYDREQNRFIPVPYTGSEELSIYCLTLVDDRLLIGTDGQGLKTYNRMTGKIEDYSINSAPLDFSEGKIHAIMEDRDKNLWVGLFQKGIVLMPKQENPFEYYGNRSIYYNPIGQGCVMSIYQDSNCHLWVGADNEGIFELDAEGKRLRHYQPGNNPRSMANTSMCMYEDTNGDFWLGTYTRGLAKLNRRTGECEYPLPVDNEKIFSITEDRHKNLYIATFGSGFYRYNLVTRELKHYESSKDESGDLTRNELANDWVNYIFCDSEGMIWLGHYKGISCFNPVNESFINYRNVNTLIEDRVGYVLQEDHAGNIWAGTTDGLYRFNKKTEELTCFTVADGLPNNVICGICEDEEHNMWISTYMGICKYNVENNRYINYYAGDGLQGNEFTHGAFYKDQAGKVYFGGINGITYFQPLSIGSVLKDTKVWITDFFIFNQPVRKNTRSGRHTVIYTSVPDANMFQLAHYDNTFSIIFSTLQYNNPEQISYQYKIEELSNQWLSTEPGVNRVTYNNLPPGKYTFHVRALSHGNLSEIRTVKILITPPWYEMWWAYCIYVFLLGLLVLGIVNYILSRMRHRREIMKREHAEQLNEAKLQFFINISHEIRTPMTLIINPLEKLFAEKKGGEVQKTYLMIYRNAQRILRLINQLMDIRKLDKGQMFMKFRETDMVGFIDDVMLTFDYMARKKKIHFSFEHAMPQLKVWVDMNNFDKILMNIFSNAFKYTPDGKSIKIEVDTNDENLLVLRVANEGSTIKEEDFQYVFNRYAILDSFENQDEKNFSRNGLGLAISYNMAKLLNGTLKVENTPDGWVLFTLSLPPLEVTTGVSSSKRITSEYIPKIESQLVLKLPHYEFDKMRPTLLVIDDELEMLWFIGEIFSNDFNVVTLQEPERVEQVLNEVYPNVIICDIMMPGVGGIELTKRIKSVKETSHIPIIMVSGRHEMEQQMAALSAGAEMYITKPFNAEYLRISVCQMLERKEVLKDYFSSAISSFEKTDGKLTHKESKKFQQSVLKIINDHIQEKELTPRFIADHLAISVRSLYRKMEEMGEESPTIMIKECRLYVAKDLLLKTKKTIDEIVFEAGFSNKVTFFKVFREKYGCTPKEFRTKHLEEVQ